MCVCLINSSDFQLFIQLWRCERSCRRSSNNLLLRMLYWRWERSRRHTCNDIQISYFVDDDDDDWCIQYSYVLQFSRLTSVNSIVVSIQAVVCFWKRHAFAQENKQIREINKIKEKNAKSSIVIRFLFLGFVCMIPPPSRLSLSLSNSLWYGKMKAKQ